MGQVPAPKPVAGHYIMKGGQPVLIHATGPGQWARGPKPGFAAPPRPQMAGPGVPLNSPLLNPGQPLSGQSLYNAAKALADAQTSPVIAALKQQVATNDQQTRGTMNLAGGFYGQLGQQAAQGTQQEQGIANDLNAQLAKIAQGTQGAIGQAGQGAQQSLARYSPGDPSLQTAAQQSLAQQIAQQQGLAAQGSQGLQDFGATQGANYGSLAASAQGTQALAGTQALKGIAQSGTVKDQPLNAQMAAQLASEGSLTAANLGKLRQAEISNAITQKGLGIKSQGLQLQQQNQAFNNNPNAPGSPASARVNQGKVAQQNANTSAKNSAFNTNPNAVGSAAWNRVQGLQGTQWSNNPAAVGSPAWARVQTANARTSGGAAKPLSTLENNHFWGTIGQIEQFVRDGQQHGQSEAQIRAALQSGSNVAKRPFDPFTVQVAYELLGYGSINQSTAATLNRQYGVRGGTYNGQPIKVTKNYNPANPAQGAGNAVKGFGSLF